MFAQPLLHAKFILNLPGLPFELHPNRILLLVILLFFAINPYSSFHLKGNLKGNKNNFELFLYLFAFFVFLSLLYNYNSGRINLNAFLAISSEIFLFILVYIVLRTYSTYAFKITFIQAFFMLTIVSSLIAIYQFLINPYFMKLCPPRIAFGEVIRSSAHFTSEYELGYILIFGLIIALSKIKKHTLMVLFPPIYLGAIITTFHRLGWIITIICLILYIIYFDNTRYAQILLIVILSMTILSFLTYFAINPNNINKLDGFIENRLLHDTLSGRFKQFYAALTGIINYPFGLGGYHNREYINLMIKHNVNPKYVVHNGFLALGLKYGVLAMVSFIIFLFKILTHLWRKIDIDNEDTIYPFVCTFIWAMANLTNSVIVFRMYYVILIAVFVGLSDRRITDDYLLYRIKSQSN